MVNRCCGLAMILSVLPLGAATIGVSGQFSALFDTGQALAFTVSSSSFSTNAANFGLPLYPTEVGFVFVSAPVDSLSQIAAVLESGDGSISASFGAPLSFVAGTFQGT